MGKMIYAYYYKILVAKPEVTGPIGKPACSWDDNIKIGLNEIEDEGVNWIKVAQGSIDFFNTAMSLPG
jgi:hypothetical protein